MSTAATYTRKNNEKRLYRTRYVRYSLFLLMWLVLLPSAKLGDLTVGMLAALLGTVASMRLLPASTGHVRLGALLRFVPHFLGQSVLAGWDVACRAFSPCMGLQPGFVACPVGFAPGHTRCAFTAVTSLLPGSVPVGDVGGAGGAVLYHCLDTRQPVAQQIAAEEHLLCTVLQSGAEHG